MKKNSMVKPERTGWRDLGLSKRHRQWGVKCPAIDVDLFLEFDHGKAAALVEYKHEYALPQFPSHPSYRALIDLGNRASIPVFACRYSNDFTQWTVTPLNQKAKVYLGQRTLMSERQWVSFLYQLRGYDPPDTF